MSLLELYTNLLMVQLMVCRYMMEPSPRTPPRTAVHFMLFNLFNFGFWTPTAAARRCLFGPLFRGWNNPNLLVGLGFLVLGLVAGVPCVSVRNDCNLSCTIQIDSG